MGVPPLPVEGEDEELDTPLLLDEEEASDEEEGFDREKLRAYEASKPRYYFAIATFTSPGAAEQVYNDVPSFFNKKRLAELKQRKEFLQH